MSSMPEITEHSSEELGRNRSDAAACGASEIEVAHEEIHEVCDDDICSAPPPHLSPLSEGSTAVSEDVYVAVGKGNSSMDALRWALRHAVGPQSFVYLVHVFPEVTHIPTPLGMMPKDKVNPGQIESHMSKESSKRRELLQKFITVCRSSRVEVDTVLIKSDQIAKAVAELIPVLRIKKLVTGVSKSSLKTARKGIGGQVKKAAPDYCNVKVICCGKEVSIIDQVSPPSPLTPRSKTSPLTPRSKTKGRDDTPPSPSTSNPKTDSKELNDEDLNTCKDDDKASVSCACFSAKFQ